MVSPSTIRSKTLKNKFLTSRTTPSKRSKPNAVFVSLHPGTVNTGLSKPFKGEQIGRTPQDAAGDMLRALNQLTPFDSGSFVSYSGERFPW